MTTDVDLKEQISKLIELQAVDSEIFDLRSLKEEFPQRLTEIDTILEGKKSGMEAAENALKQLQIEKGEKDNELVSAEEKIKKHEGELALIKTNKEYSAMLEQIESVKADVSLVEERIIELLDSVEAAKSRCEEEKKIFEDELKKSNAEKDTIRSEEAEITKKLDELSQKRGTLTSGIDDKFLGIYERVLANRGRHALSKVNGEMCEECNMRLRPQLINEVRLQKTLVLCENCSRILYAEE